MDTKYLLLLSQLAGARARKRGNALIWRQTEKVIQIDRQIDTYIDDELYVHI